MNIVGFERIQQQVNCAAQVMETTAIFSSFLDPLILSSFRQQKEPMSRP